MQQLVTIGIPFLDNEKTLTDSIVSVLNQTESRWRLLLIDDGSSDRSLAMARSFGDPRISVLSDGVRRGLVARLNQMVSLCDTPYFARMDSDDIMHPQRLERQLQHLESRPELDIVSSGAWIIDEQNRVTGRRTGATQNLTLRAFLAATPFLHPSVTGRTDWFRRHPYHPRYVRMEDGELWFRTLAADELQYAVQPEPLMFYREPSNIDPRKILASYHTRRLLIREHGPSVLGWWKTALIHAELTAKQLAWNLAHLGGDASWLLRRRSQALDAAELREAERILQIAVGSPEETVRFAAA